MDAQEIHIIEFKGTGVFNPETLEAVHTELDAVIADESITAVFLRGEGKSFSQGLDLEYLMAHQEIFSEFVTATMDLAARLMAFPVPVVSVVNGHAFGLGAMLVLASDYAVMREDRGFFCLPEINIGMTLTVRMNALVQSRMSPIAVRDCLLTGAHIPAHQALQLGIVDAIAPEEELYTRAVELSEPMRGKPRHLLSGLKYGQNKALVDLIKSDAEDDPITAPTFWSSRVI
jgi:Delta3-Delta2-enoyl-CoA isomerase